jgi:hypothetical protein
MSVTTYKDGRPTFYFNDSSEMPCRAAGIMPFFNNNGKLEFLHIISKNDAKVTDNEKKTDEKEIETLGGKTDMADKDICETAIREADEESNRILKFEKKQLTKYLYFPRSKYILFFVEIKDKVSTEQFGTREIYEGIDRTFEWLTFKQICKSKMRKLDKRKYIEEIGKYIEIYRKDDNISVKDVLTCILSVVSMVFLLKLVVSSF